jgi:hypothetical protein
VEGGQPVLGKHDQEFPYSVTVAETITKSPVSKVDPGVMVLDDPILEGKH